MYSKDIAQDQIRSMEQEIKQSISGDVHFDQLTRHLYSTDASDYCSVPTGVVIPRHPDDIVAVTEIINRYGGSLVPRGGGSSVSGQSIGPGVILDYSRYLNHIQEINREERWVRVEAGTVLDRLNTALQPDSLMVGPDPSSAVVATLGGMIANNATGSHSIKYRMMVNHVQEVDVILSDGSRVCFSPKTPAEVETLAKHASLEGQLYREIPRLVARYQADIATGYPRTWRNVAGYNLNYLLADQETSRLFNLAPLIVGSEGTLANIISAKVGLVPRPSQTRLMILHFNDLRTAMEEVPFILEGHPSAIELTDRTIIHLARSHPQFAQRLNRFVFGDPAAILTVEFAGDEASYLALQTDSLEKRLRKHGYKLPIIHCVTPDEIDNFWLVRTESNGLISSKPGDVKRPNFIDDPAVPVEELPDYVMEIEQACREAGTEINFNSHASVGCLHMNPALNLKTAEGLSQMEIISKLVMKIAINHHGTTTGEHGEGLARSYYNEMLYGSSLHQAFRYVKGLFDPDNVMNPGKIIDGPAPWEPELLRFNPSYKTPQAPQNTFLSFDRNGSFAGLVEMCNGQGMCRTKGAGVMCPSFRVTSQEMHSTRGRANALRAAMTGQLGPEGMTSRELYEALDLCLECKACKRECSASVDMAKLKYEFLAGYQAKHGVPLRSWLFGHVELLNRIGSIVPKLTNLVYSSGVFRWSLDRILGIDRRRKLPDLAPTTFQSWFRRRSSVRAATRGMVVLWDDCYLSYNNPEIGVAAVKVLEASGFEVKLIENRRCCGRPMISKGLLREARENAAHNVSLLAPYAAQGVPIIGLEPSCIATFRDEYPDLLSSEAARQVATASFFIEEFLANLITQGELELTFETPEKQRHILVHGHCYQKALTSTSQLLKMLSTLPNTVVEEIPSGCCGMAGSFGYEKEHYEISLAVGEEVLLPKIRAASQDTIIAAAGTSCRQQIVEGTGRQPIHPIIVVANAVIE